MAGPRASFIRRFHCSHCMVIPSVAFPVMFSDISTSTATAMGELMETDMPMVALTPSLTSIGESGSKSSSNSAKKK